MGTVPISNISPLTVTRSEEPTLEPPAPIYRVENSSKPPSGSDEESYSPSNEKSAADVEAAQPEPQPNQDPATADPTHQINLFA